MDRMRRVTVSTLGSAAFLLLPAVPLHGQFHSGDWPAYNRNPYGYRFSPLGEINTTNVARLEKICAVDIPGGRSFQTGILAVNGTLFATTDMATYAIDGETCAIRSRRTRERLRRTCD